MKDGVNATTLPTVNTTGYIDHAAFLGTLNPDTNEIPKHLFQAYLNIYHHYVQAPCLPERTEANPNERNQDDARYGFRCCHLKNMWTAPLPLFFSSRRRHTRLQGDWSSDVCSSDLDVAGNSTRVGADARPEMVHFDGGVFERGWAVQYLLGFAGRGSYCSGGRVHCGVPAAAGRALLRFDEAAGQD